MKLYLHYAVEFSVCFILTNVCAKFNRPRGVSIAKAPLYQPSDIFTCFDGLKIIDFKQINDDFCDCVDGSDEPGTSACSNGTFDCDNFGYRSISLPSSRVNDGICDCCDGSDEYEAPFKCTNLCLGLGQQLRESLEKQRLHLSSGHELFKEYVKKGDEMKKEAVKNLESLDKEKKDVETLKSELRELKMTAERAAQGSNVHAGNYVDELATVYFRELDINQDNFVTASELFSHMEFDTDHDGQVTLDEARSRLGDRDQVDYETFLDSVWDNLQSKYSRLVSINSVQQEQGIESDAENVQSGLEHRDEAKLEPPASDNNNESELDSQSNVFMTVAERTRKEFEEVSERLTTVMDEMLELQGLLRDVTPSQYFTFHNECYNVTDNVFVYSFCPFKRIIRRAASDEYSTLIGKWSGWVHEPVSYSGLVYEDGADCDNAYSMSAMVFFECSTWQQLIFIGESQSCLHSFTFKTPAACSQPPPITIRDPLRDEL